MPSSYIADEGNHRSAYHSKLPTAEAQVASIFQLLLNIYHYYSREDEVDEENVSGKRIADVPVKALATNGAHIAKCSPTPPWVFKRTLLSRALTTLLSRASQARDSAPRRHRREPPRPARVARPRPAILRLRCTAPILPS